MSNILQGTTPTLTITINPDDVALINVEALELTFRQSSDPVIHDITECTIDTEANTVSYHFSEAETLALDPRRALMWQLRLKTTDGNIVGTPIAQINVSDLISTEVLGE